MNFIKFLGLVLLLLHSLGYPVNVCGICPNRCSGHGRCTNNPEFRCICFEGFTGGDCSRRSCPKGKAWVGHSKTTDGLHDEDIECSGVGECNPSNGRCACREAFGGENCGRLKCGTDSDGKECHGNGRCMTIRQAGMEKDGLLLKEEISYDLWDADRIYGCICDIGFSGHDCSQKDCPIGDDPLLPGLLDRKERQIVEFPENVTQFKFMFRHYLTSTLSLDDDTKGSDIKRELERLQTIKEVTVTLMDSLIEELGTHVDNLTSGSFIHVTFEEDVGPLPNIRLLDNDEGFLRNFTKLYQQSATCDGANATDGAIVLFGSTGETDPLEGISLTASAIKDELIASFQEFTTENVFVKIRNGSRLKDSFEEDHFACGDTFIHVLTNIEGDRAVSLRLNHSATNSTVIFDEYKASVGTSLKDQVQQVSCKLPLQNPDDAEFRLEYMTYDKKDKQISKRIKANATTTEVESIIVDLFTPSLSVTQGQTVESPVKKVEIFNSDGELVDSACSETGHFIHITISEPKIGHRVVKPIRVKAEQSIIPCQASSTYRICFKKRCTRWMERSATLRRVNRELHGIIGSNTITLTGQFAFQGEKEDQIACQGLSWIVTFNSIRGRVSPLLVLEVDGENPRNFTQEVQGFDGETELSATYLLTPFFPETQRLDCECSGEVCGKFTLSFGGHTTAPIEWNAVLGQSQEDSRTSSFDQAPGRSVESLLAELFPFEIYSTTTIDGLDGNDRICRPNTNTSSLITFRSAVGNVPLIEVNSADKSLAIDIIPLFEGRGGREPCSGRGTCNSGVCSCFEGWESSNGNHERGTYGNCGFYQGAPTCPGETDNNLQCSGHGKCSGSPHYRCECDPGFAGVDCDSEECQKAEAWFDEPKFRDRAHFPAICSNKGTCLSSSGRCSCQSGYEGAACELLTCPSIDRRTCNQFGRCVSLSDYMKQHTMNNEPLGDIESVSYRMFEIQEVRLMPQSSEERIAFAFRGALSTSSICENLDPSSLKSLLANMTQNDAKIIEDEDKESVSVTIYDNNFNSLKSLSCDGSLNRIRIEFQSKKVRGNVPELVTNATNSKVSETRPGSFYETQDFICNTTSSFRLSFMNEDTKEMNHNASKTEIQMELHKLHWIGHIDVTLLSNDVEHYQEVTYPVCSENGSTKVRVQFSDSVFHFGQQPLLKHISEGITTDFDRFQPFLLASYGLNKLNRNTWDAQRITACVCGGKDFNATASDAGDVDGNKFTGISCRYRQCPHGVDPRTPAPPLQRKRVLERQEVFCRGSSGQFSLRFRGFETKNLGVNDSTVLDLKRVLRELPTVGRLRSLSNITDPICSDEGTTTVLRFMTELGDLPMIQPLVHSPDVIVETFETRKGVGILQPCARRGLCSPGMPVSDCQCYDGYYSSDGDGSLGARGDCGAKIINLPD